MTKKIQLKKKNEIGYIKKTKILLIDLFDLIISFMRINKTKTYKDIIIQSSISPLVRGATHNSKNLTNIIKLTKKYTTLISRILWCNFKLNLIPKKIKFKKSTNFELVIVYPDNDDWILRGISQDIEKEIRNLNKKVKACPLSNITNYKFKKVLFIHHEIALKAVRLNPKLLEISNIYLSHIRTIKLQDIELMSKFNFIFCQSAKDQMRLYSLGFLPGRVIHLPIGFDSNLFFENKKYEEREYDFVLSTPLKINSIGSHYWLRKSSQLILETLSVIAQKGYKIMIIGKGWENSLLSCNKNIEVIECLYEEKNIFLNNCKTFLNLSLLEGGPVTLLEAIASGCNSISKDNGFSIDLSLDFPDRCKNIKNILSSDQLSQKIITIYMNNLRSKNSSISESLNLYSYNHLSKKILKILDF